MEHLPAMQALRRKATADPQLALMGACIAGVDEAINKLAEKSKSITCCEGNAEGGKNDKAALELIWVKGRPG